MIFLNNEQYFKKYFEIYETIQLSYFKFEVLQEFVEYDIKDWNKVSGASMLNIITKAQTNVFKSKERFENVRQRGVELNRVRFLEFPLSKYILRQFSTYLISQEIGENIQIYEANCSPHLTTEDLNDFILLDDAYLFVLKYEEGELKGAFFTDDFVFIKPYIVRKNFLLENSIEFNEFIKSYNITLNKLI